MHLVQILLPLADNARYLLDLRLFARIKEELTRHFGGITCYFRAPAEVRWSNEGEDVIDDIVIYEVMLEQVDPGWWADYRKTLERHFQQNEIVIRAVPMSLL
ncbi:hypothetical protein [Prosthecobacter sp.]|uniref:hypothetical protein n=1 Tax=Prosthecobacter sp. TaxID=1965333 RepID=UPI0037842205